MTTKELPRKWKTLLLEARTIDARLTTCLYRRTKLLCEIFDDAEFRAEVGARDDLQAAAWLDAEFKGVALKFLQLRAILAEYPQESHWRDGNLQDMFEAIRPTLPEERPERTRKAVKVVDYKEACSERDHYKTRVKFLDEQLTQLQKEREEHQQEIARLKGRIEELERLFVTEGGLARV